jgi:ProP effector
MTMTDTPDPEKTVAAKPRRRPKTSEAMPVLERLAELYPQLFGAVFQPLKRGIFQDLMEAHPDLCDKAALKAALAHHTRSTRYLVAVAEGRQRHDLAGKPVEAMAPEHVHHALLEVFGRRQARSNEDLRPTLRRRMVQAFERSGLAPDAYAALVLGRNEEANQLLDEALQEVRATAAKDEALLRAFDGGTHSVQAFAEMYGMDVSAVEQALERARRVRARAAPAAD